MKTKNIFSVVAVTLVLIVMGVSITHSVFPNPDINSDTQQAAIGKAKCLDLSKKKHTLDEIVKCLPKKQKFSFKPSIPFYARPFVSTKDLNKLVNDCMSQSETTFSGALSCITDGIQKMNATIRDSALKEMASNIESLLSTTYGLSDIDAATLLLGITQGSPAGNMDDVKCDQGGQCSGSIVIN